MRTRALTPGEKDTLDLIARGFTDEECASMLGVSRWVIGTRVAAAKQKLGASTRANLIWEWTLSEM